MQVLCSSFEINKGSCHITPVIKLGNSLPQDVAEAKSVIRFLKGLRTGPCSLLNTEVWSLASQEGELLLLKEHAGRKDHSRHACSPYSCLLK